MFKTVDARTGTVLWRTRLSTSVEGFPVSFRVGKKQYIAVETGLGSGACGVPGVVVSDVDTRRMGTVSTC